MVCAKKANDRNRQWFKRRRRKLCSILTQRIRRARKQRQNMQVHRIDWDVHVATLREGEFTRRYRMSAEKFQYLLKKCAETSKFFQEASAKSIQSVRKLYSKTGGPIDPRHKLAAAIRWFAGGSYLDIHLVHTMSHQQLYECVWEAVDAINSSDKLQLHFPWDDEVGLQNLERGFSEMSGGKLRVVVFSQLTDTV